MFLMSVFYSLFYYGQLQPCQQPICSTPEAIKGIKSHYSSKILEEWAIKKEHNCICFKSNSAKE